MKRDAPPLFNQCGGDVPHRDIPEQRDQSNGAAGGLGSGTPSPQKKIKMRERKKEKKEKKEKERARESEQCKN